MNHDAYLLPVHIAMLLMVIGFGVFFYIIIDGTKKTIKITKKAVKKSKKAIASFKKHQLFKKNWNYDI
jgi:hypothetical protein